MKKHVLFFLLVLSSFVLQAQSYTIDGVARRFTNRLGIPIKDTATCTWRSDTAHIHFGLDDRLYVARDSGIHFAVSLTSDSTAILSQVVRTYGAQSINGEKTFNNTITVGSGISLGASTGIGSFETSTGSVGAVVGTSNSSTGFGVNAVNNSNGVGLVSSTSNNNAIRSFNNGLSPNLIVRNNGGGSLIKAIRNTTDTVFSVANNGTTTVTDGTNYSSLGLASVSAGNATLQVQLSPNVITYSQSGNTLGLYARNLTGSRTVYFQNKSYTVADSADVASIAANYLPLTGGTLTGDLNLNTRFSFAGASSTSATVAGQEGWNTTVGRYLYPKAGATNDFTLYNGAGATVLVNPTGTQNITLSGALSGTSGTFTQGSAITTLTARGDWDAGATNNSQLYLTGFSNTNKQLRLGFETTSNYGYIQAITSGTGTNSLALNPSGGNVGINTTLPTYKFSVSLDGNSDYGLFIKNTNTGVSSSIGARIAFNEGNGNTPNATLGMIRNGSDEFEINNLITTGIVTVKTNGSERLRVNSSGHLLVNTSTTDGTSVGQFNGQLLVGSTSNRGIVKMIGTSGASPYTWYIDNQSGGNDWLSGAGIFAVGNYEIFDQTGGVLALSIAKTTRAATFSSDLRVNGIIRDYQGEALLQTSGSTTFLGSGGAGTPRSLSFYAGNAERLTIATTGAATFSSTLGINGVSDNVKGSTYSPTAYNLSANISTGGVTLNAFTYIRVGNVVHVSGSVSVANVTATGSDVYLEISLPVASNFTSSIDATGTGTVADAFGYFAVRAEGEAGNDRLTIAYSPTTTGASIIRVMFQYEVK